MADNVVVTAGSGTTVAADEIVDGVLGTVKVQYVKLMDGTLDGTTKCAVGANGLACDVKAIATGTNTIGAVNLAQYTPVSGRVPVDGSGVTQPVSGTVTANIGTIGTIATEASLAKTTILQGATLGANTQTMVGGSVTTAAPTYVTGQISPFSLDTAGNLRVTGGGFSQADRAAFTDGTTQVNPISGVFNESNTAPTEDQAAAIRITAQRALHINIRNNTGTELGISATPLRTDPTGTTAQPVTDNAGSLTVDSTQFPAALGQTTMAASFAVAIASNQSAVLVDSELPAAATLADATANPSTTSVGALNSLFNGTTWDRVRGDTTNGMDVDVTRLSALVAGTATIGNVVPTVSATDSLGCSVFFNSALTNTVVNAKASAGNLYGWYISNNDTVMNFIQIFNSLAVNVTLGTTTPILSLGIPASSAANIWLASAVGFSTVISLAATTTATGSTVPAVSQTVNILYK